MARRPIKIRIDLKKIDQSLCYRSDKTGAVYLDLVAWEVDDSRYGETHRVSQDEPKDYDGDRLPICGNLTDPEKVRDEDRRDDRRDDRREPSRDRNDDRRGDRRDDRREPSRDPHGRDRSTYRGQGGTDGNPRDDRRGDRREDDRPNPRQERSPREAAQPAYQQEREPRETSRAGNWGRERPTSVDSQDEIPF